MNASLFHRNSRKVYFVAAVLVFFLEVLIERYAHDDFVRPYLGDFLVVILLYSICMALSNLKIIQAAMITLLFSYTIETAQYFQFVALIGLEDQKWARIIIGTSFSWWDLLMYTLGILTVLFVERWSGKKS